MDIFLFLRMAFSTGESQLNILEMERYQRNQRDYIRRTGKQAIWDTKLDSS